MATGGGGHAQDRLRQYLGEHQLEALLKDLLTAVMYRRPERPLDFMLACLIALKEARDAGRPVDNDVLFRSIDIKTTEIQANNQTKETDNTSNNQADNQADNPSISTSNNQADEEETDAFDADAQLPRRTDPLASTATDSAAASSSSTSSLSPSDLGVNYNRARRGSVSAESLKPVDNFDQLSRIIIPKSNEARVRIAAATANNLLFRNLEPDQRREVVDAMFEKRVTANDIVIQQGDEGDNFYVVDDGLFDVIVNGNKVVEIGPGGSFGELALMYNTPRAATVKATKDGVLWAVDRVTFRHCVTNNMFRKRKLYESFLKTVPILATLEPSEIAKIADALEPQEFEDGDHIISQGDPGNSFYILVEGSAVATKQSSSPHSDQKKNENAENENSTENEEVVVKEYSTGGYFGELSLLTDRPRAATVKAQGRVKVVCLDAQAFIRLLGPCMDILKRNAEAYKKYEKVLEKEEPEEED